MVEKVRIKMQSPTPGNKSVLSGLTKHDKEEGGGLTLRLQDIRTGDEIQKSNMEFYHTAAAKYSKTGRGLY